MLAPEALQAAKARLEAAAPPASSPHTRMRWLAALSALRSSPPELVPLENGRKFLRVPPSCVPGALREAASRYGADACHHGNIAGPCAALAMASLLRESAEAAERIAAHESLIRLRDEAIGEWASALGDGAHGQQGRQSEEENSDIAVSAAQPRSKDSKRRDLAIYAAVRCAGRWGEIKAVLSAACWAEVGAAEALDYERQISTQIEQRLLR